MAQTIVHHDILRWRYPELSDIEALMQGLATYTLDPRFEDYGNFIDTNPRAARPNGYNTDGQAIYIDTGPIYPDMPGAVQFWGNFFDVSGCFRIGTNDPALIERLTGAIRANQATPAYHAAKAEAARAKREVAEQEAKRRRMYRGR